MHFNAWTFLSLLVSCFFSLNPASTIHAASGSDLAGYVDFTT